jgi:peptidoglycan/LPS O-acetylase OafA/YrhL
MIKTRIPEIDALRGIACLMVVFNHFRLHPQLNHFGFNIGCVGVDLFFIISGFVISLTIQNNKSPKDFLINRFSRLFPTYWVCVTLSVIAIVLSHKYIGEPPLDLSFFKRYLLNLSMLQFYLNTTNIDGSYWTLIIELLFYVFILCFLLIKQTKLIELIGGICLILPICLFVFYNEIIANETLHRLVDAIPLLAYIPLFYSGILCYNLFFNGKKIYRWALLAISFCIQLALFDKYYSNGPELTFMQYLITLSLIYLSFVLLIFQKMKFLVNPYTIWLGNISFCLYLIHQSIGVFIVTPILHDYFHLNFWIAFILTLAFLLFLANLIYTYVEKPIISYIRKHFITT